jgi:hypothetical protein
MKTNTTVNSTSETQTFEIEAQQVIARVRSAFGAILDSLPGHVARAHEVSKALGIHRKLGWQIANVVYEPDLFAAAHHIPGQASVRSFLAAATERRVNRELIASAEDAMADFDRLIEIHAGGRKALDMMLTGCAGDAAKKAHLAQRKAWFAAGSHIWGVQAKAQINANFLHPATRAGWFDLVYVNGLVRFRRTRSDVSWPIGLSKRTADDGATLTQPKREALEDTSASAGVPLVPQFCSGPLPPVRRRTLAGEFIRDELLPGPVGKTGALDCVTGEVWREIGPCYRTEHDWLWYASIPMRTPCEVVILDQFVHHDLFGPIQPEVHLYRDLLDGPRLPVPQRPGDRMPLFESVQYLGKGISGIRTPDVPRYDEMVRYVFERLGWDPRRFDAFRVRMEYPPVPTTVTMESPLREPPA